MIRHILVTDKMLQVTMSVINFSEFGMERKYSGFEYDIPTLFTKMPISNPKIFLAMTS